MKPDTGDPVWLSSSPAVRVAVITALELEAAALRQKLRHNCPAIHVSGPGRERARAAARRAIDAGASALIAWGLAGGIQSQAVTGSVILADRLLASNGQWTTDPAWRARVREALGSSMPVFEQPIFSADAVVTTVSGKSSLAEATGAVAVDMESAAIAEAAAEADLPCLIVRVIADGPDDELPDRVEMLVTDDGQTRIRGLLSVATSPRQLALLFGLARNSQSARRVLKRVAARLQKEHT